MQVSLKVLSLSLLLAAPVTLTLPAQAQEIRVLPAVQALEQAQQQFPILKLAEVAQLPIEEEAVAQRYTDDEAFQAYVQHGYNYIDARLIANFWSMGLAEAKYYMGRKVLSGLYFKSLLTQQLLDARIKALGNVESLQFFVDDGYTYDDARELSEFWGDATPWESKLRIERNIIMGDGMEVRRALGLAREGQH